MKYVIRIYYGVGMQRYIMNVQAEDENDADSRFEAYEYYMDVDPLGIISEVRFLQNEKEIKRRVRCWIGKTRSGSSAN